MKKLLLLCAAILMAIAPATAQDDEAPLYKGFGEITVNESYAPLYDDAFPAKKGIIVDGYDGYFIIRAFAGVEGYDLMIEYDDDTDNVLSVTPIIDGEEGDLVSKGYLTVNTGLDDESNKYLQFYIGQQYSYAGVDTDDYSGYTLLTAYNAAGAYIYYYLEWEAYPEDCLYISLGETTSTEGWGATLFPSIRDIKVEAYDGYVIVRSLGGVDGYDMMVELGDDDAIISVTPIVDDEEGDMYTKGYFDIPTGRDDFAYIQAYLGTGYCYGGLYDDESGYILLGCYLGSDWNYYLSWPQEEEGSQTEWQNPFDQPATYLYTATARVESIVDKEGTAEEDAWGESVLPSIDGVKVDVYDTYIHIHALGGIEGYDAKVAYDADENVLSIIGITDGKESDPSRTYLYLQTGRDDYDIIQAYNSYSYAASYGDCSGYVTLAGYIYEKDTEASAWSYYNLTWQRADDSAVSTLANSPAQAVSYNLAGQRVTPSYHGIVITSGRKVMQR